MHGATIRFIMQRHFTAYDKVLPEDVAISAEKCVRVLIITHVFYFGVNDQLGAQLRCIKRFIIVILYMFRASLRSSSGGRIVLIQHLV